jgi:hypothetical protein
MLALQDFQISRPEKARKLVQTLFQPLPLLQKGLYRRWQLFGIDGFLRAASAASYAHLIASMTIRLGGGGTLLARLGFAFSAIGPR